MRESGRIKMLGAKSSNIPCPPCSTGLMVQLVVQGCCIHCVNGLGSPFNMRGFAHAVGFADKVGAGNRQAGRDDPPGAAEDAAAGATGNDLADSLPVVGNAEAGILVGAQCCIPGAEREAEAVGSFHGEEGGSSHEKERSDPPEEEGDSSHEKRGNGLHEGEGVSLQEEV
jgi:hypothetical protein